MYIRPAWSARNTYPQAWTRSSLDTPATKDHYSKLGYGMLCSELTSTSLDLFLIRYPSINDHYSKHGYEMFCSELICTSLDLELFRHSSIIGPLSSLGHGMFCAELKCTSLDLGLIRHSRIKDHDSKLGYGMSCSELKPHASIWNSSDTPASMIQSQVLLCRVLRGTQIQKLEPWPHQTLQHHG